MVTGPLRGAMGLSARLLHDSACQTYSLTLRLIANVGHGRTGGAVQYVARTPPDFLDTLQKVKWTGESRWTDPATGYIYTYDRRHGHVEEYNARGRHVGVVDVKTGERIKGAEKGRRTDV